MDWLGEAQALLEGLPPLEAAPGWDDPPSDEGGSYQGGDDSDGIGGGGTHREWDWEKLAAYEAESRLEILPFRTLFQGLDEGVFQMIHKLAHAEPCTTPESWDPMPTLEWAHGPGPPYLGRGRDEKW